MAFTHTGTPSDLTIRAFTGHDYDRMAAFYTLVEPDYPVTADELRRGDAIRDPKLKVDRFFAERGEELVGVARYGQAAGLYHPQKFFLHIHVHPTQRRQGVGSALYERLLDALTPFDPIVLRGEAKENRPEAVRFWEARDFVEEDRHWESRLDPQTFDPAPYAHLGEKVRAAGVTLEPLSNLMDAQPDWKRLLYDLDWELTQDEPLPEAPTRKDFGVYAKYFDTPDFLPDALLVARYKGAWRGFSELQGSEANPRHLYNGFTAVGAELRGNGVATALKVQNLIWAKAHGFTEIKTWNNALNAPMLAVNTKLGFTRQPAEINFKKEV